MYKAVTLLLNIFYLFIIYQNTHAQTQKNTVSGDIIDHSGTPLPFAIVTLDSTHKNTTDVNGAFTFKNISDGSYNLKVESFGFKTQSKKIIVDRQDVHTTLKLKELINELDAVVIISKTETQRIESSGFAVNAVEMKDVENQSIQTNEVLDRSVGVRIRQDGGLGSRVRYNLNGLTGNSIRIFIDGIPIENYGSAFSLSSIPTSMIERIEVYKGVVPAEFGTDALGGAINVITKRNAPNTLNTSYSFGSFNTHQWSANGNYSDSISGFSVKGSAFYNYSDNNYKVWGNQIYNTDEFGKIKYVTGERFHDSYRSLGSKIDVGVTNKKWADQFFIGFLGSEMKKDIQHGATMENVYGNRHMDQKTWMINTSYNKKNLFTKGLDIQFFTSYSTLKRTLVDTVPYIYNWYGKTVDLNGDGKPEEWASGAESNTPTLNIQDEKKYVARINLSYKVNKHNTFGINHISTSFNRKPDDKYWVQTQRDLTDTRYLNKFTTGLYYQNNAFKEKLKTSVFAKSFIQKVRLKDIQRAFGGDLEPLIFNEVTNHTGYGVALAYAIQTEFQILASAEKAVRLPTSTETFGNEADAIDAAFELKPEQSYNANLGFNLGPITYSKHAVSLNSNLFYRNTIGMIRQVVAREQAETYAYENQDKVLSKGIDVEVTYKYDKKIKLVLGSSIFNARFNKQFDEFGSQYIYYKDRLRNAPYYTFNGNILYMTKNLFQNKSRFSCYYNLGYVHQFYRNWESIGNKGKNIIPSQLAHDMGISYTFPSERITLSADAKNMFNEQIFDNWALQKPGRAFYTKLTYKLK